MSTAGSELICSALTESMKVTSAIGAFLLVQSNASNPFLAELATNEAGVIGRTDQQVTAVDIAIGGVYGRVAVSKLVPGSILQLTADGIIAIGSHVGLGSNGKITYLTPSGTPVSQYCVGVLLQGSAADGNLVNVRIKNRYIDW